MKTNIFIPKTLNVGFQNRKDTFTGKLAYIIYYDEKGKLRKEVSWDNWRDKTIDNLKCDNKPTEGFILNKEIGGYRSSWNTRKEHIRVYDPRGFEFEITVKNLLYILEHTDCIKGKGLKGEFVYGWDKTDLVLLPVTSPEYTEMQKFTEKVNSGVLKKADLIEGHTYLGKDNKKYTYLGKFPTYTFGFQYVKNNKIVHEKEAYDMGNWNNIKRVSIPKGENYWFAYRYGEKTKEFTFEQYKNIPSKLIDDLGVYDIDDFISAKEYMQYKPEYSPIDDNKTQFIRYTYEQFKDMIDNDMKKAFICISETYGRGNFTLHDFVYSDSGFAYQIAYECKNRTFTGDILPIAIKHVNYLRNDAVEDNEYLFDKAHRFGHSQNETWKYDITYGMDVKKEEISNFMSIKEAYDKLKPGFIVRYLKNDKFFESKQYHLNYNIEYDYDSREFKQMVKGEYT